ncbi:MAG TPA: helix-turn-helix transcriptional regulator [Candidatus Sulfotelmatobacter sp.]
MTGTDLKQARLAKHWTQKRAAQALGVSQAYLSLLEGGHRPVSGKLMRTVLGTYEMSPLSLPFLSETTKAEAPTNDDWARHLGSLGYSGFSYLKDRPTKNPAEVLLGALTQADLDGRVVKGLPWLVASYLDMNWQWLVERAKQSDVQNRLGFTATLARQDAARRGLNHEVLVLTQREASLERSRLAREDTYCHDSLTEAEKRWLREARSPEAGHWNLLTDLTAEQLTYAL